jgi:hypothetical protein
VQELAFFVATLLEFGIKIAFRHFAHVIFVQKLTVVAFLAQTAQPVFAQHGLVAFQVAKRTLATFGTARFHEELAYSRSGFLINHAKTKSIHLNT